MSSTLIIIASWVILLASFVVSYFVVKLLTQYLNL
nr:MAG TPA: hypothetical protein [Caudoviricetes sp.]